MVSSEIDQMLVKDGSNIHQMYRSRVKDFIRDRSNISQRWVKYKSEMGQISVRDRSNGSQGWVKYPSDIQVKSNGSRWR